MDNDGLEFREFHWMMVMLQSLDAGVIVLDRDYRIQVWNSFMENHSGRRPENIRGKNIFECFPELAEDWFRRKAEPVFLLQSRAFSTWEQRPYIFEYKNYRPITGLEELMYQNITFIPLTSLEGTVDHICVLIYDVSDIAISKKELETANGRLKYLCRIDSLTQLNNRGYWEECLAQEFKRFKRYGKPVSLIMLDIDHFKSFNDTYGHQLGDQVIQVLSQTIKENIRETDIAGRYGGEEFAIILTDTDTSNSLNFAERLRKDVESREIIIRNERLIMTVSLGLSEFDEEMAEYEDLIKQSDKALYESKRTGRNKVTLYNHDKDKIAAQ